MSGANITILVILAVGVAVFLAKRKKGDQTTQTETAPEA